ncbi:MAG: hypothetical protein QOE40_2941 [Actinomycetota bacterium]|nr:hypothetical protein [Actinomycetota bacterium]
MQELSPAARLAAWGGAALTGDVSLDDAADAVAGPHDPGHRLFGLGAEQAGVNLAYALGRLRADGARALRLVLPRPGDVGGLPGPPAFNEKAVARGEAVLTVGGPPQAILPEGRGAWTLHQVVADKRTPLSLRDAERAVNQVMREATQLLLSLDVARWEPAAAEVLLHQSARATRPLLPSTTSPQAHHVLTLSQRLLGIVEVARRSDGAALTAAATAARAQALRELEAAARHGLEAACSTPVG